MKRRRGGEAKSEKMIGGLGSWVRIFKNLSKEKFMLYYVFCMSYVLNSKNHHVIDATSVSVASLLIFLSNSNTRGHCWDDREGINQSTETHWLHPPRLLTNFGQRIFVKQKNRGAFLIKCDSRGSSLKLKKKVDDKLKLWKAPAKQGMRPNSKILTLAKVCILSSILINARGCIIPL